MRRPGNQRAIKHILKRPDESGNKRGKSMTRIILAISIIFFGLSLDIERAAQGAQNSGQRQRNASQAANSSQATQWALLIGVSNYPGEIQDLRFAGADAKSIKELLSSSGGIPEDHIRLLTDDGVGESKATKQN